MFFTFTFVGSKLKNQLIMHLGLIVKMYMQEFFKLDNFPFYTAIIRWSESEKKYSYVVEMQHDIHGLNNLRLTFLAS